MSTPEQMPLPVPTREVTVTPEYYMYRSTPTATRPDAIYRHDSFKETSTYTGDNETVEAAVAAHEQTDAARCTITEGAWPRRVDAAYNKHIFLPRDDTNRHTWAKQRADVILNRNGVFTPADLLMLGHQKISAMNKQPLPRHGQSRSLGHGIALGPKMRQELDTYLLEQVGEPLSAEAAPFEKTLELYEDIRQASPAILLPTTDVTTFDDIQPFHRLGQMENIALLTKRQLVAWNYLTAAEHVGGDRALRLSRFIFETAMPAIRRFDGMVHQYNRDRTINDIRAASVS
jgi:hypothetical protein